MEPILFMLIGLPASGKSTIAKQIAKEYNATICSSDKLRFEMFGDEEVQNRNQEVFQALHKNIKECLRNNGNVVYDAQNISSKRRRAFLEELKNIKCKKIAILIACPYKKCLEQNKLRERKVPEEVIKRSYLNFNIPFKQEGFDDIWIKYPKDFNFTCPIVEVLKSYKIEHNNPHHTQTIGKHMILAFKYLVEKYSNASDILKIATFIHDIGKPFCKKFENYKGDKTEVAHYYNHQNVGAYDCLFLNIDEHKKLDIALLIQYHMQPLIAWEQSLNTKIKDEKLLGQKTVDEVKILSECDQHGK